MRLGREPLRSVTGQELLETLQDLSPEQLQKPVVFSVDYGDHGHTPQAVPLTGEVEDVKVEPTAYSQSGFAIVDRDNEDDTDENQLDGFLLIK